MRKRKIPKCPVCGETPIGTAERVLATALIAFDEKDGTPFYTGDTDICYDGQETIVRDGRIILVCANGDEFPAPEGFKVEG